MLRLWASLCWSTTLVAQGLTFVVDASSGPGANFTDIQAAVLTVPSGSILIVRAGTYSPVLVDGMDLTILCDPGVQTSIAGLGIPFLEVRNTLPSQTVTVRGLHPTTAWIHGYMVVANAAGPVTLDGVAAQVIGTLTVSNSPQVDVRNWWLTAYGAQAAASVTNSVVAFERCTLLGADAFLFDKGYGQPSSAALFAANSHVQLVHTIARGGAGASSASMGGVLVLPGSAAIELVASHLRATGLASHALQGGTTPAVGQLPAIVGNGIARVDPVIPMNAMPGPGIVLTRPTMPSLLATSAAPGNVVTIERYGAPGVLCAVAISLRGPSTSLPGLVDPIWIDAQSLVVESVALTPASGSFTVQKPVPNQPALRGFQFVFQAADLTAMGLVELSNPSPCFVR